MSPTACARYSPRARTITEPEKYAAHLVPDRGGTRRRCCERVEPERVTHPSSGLSPDRFRLLLLDSLREAASLARSLEGQVHNRPKRDEATEVKQALTEGDTAAQEVLLERLLEEFPEVRLEAEEDTPHVLRFPTTSDAAVVIDPIDGTLHSYLEGSGPYSVIMGLAIRGVYRAALVALPREGLFFDAAAGCGARMSRAGGQPRGARVDATGNRVLVSHGTPDSVSSRLREQGFDPVPSSGGAVSVAPLIAGVRAGLRFVPNGSGISIRGRVGALISREAGAFVRGRAGAPFPEDMHSAAPVLLLAAAEADLALLDEALDAAGDAAT
jgi:fructose-1,6-bisphosphatase/inositol monophosphatase family enzyme